MTPPTPIPRASPIPGPRPLPLHMALLSLTCLISRAAWTSSNAGSKPWRPELRAAAETLQTRLEAVDPAAFAQAIETEALRRHAKFAEGVAAFNARSKTRRLSPPPVLWQAGTTRLLDYGMDGKGRPLLVVPSLVNRAYILDLSARRSLMRWLAGRGFRPLLVDWDAPGEAERSFDLSDYVAGRLEDALEAAWEAGGRRPVGLIGYCMGGTLAVALATRRADRVGAFAALATPWDFAATDPARLRMLEGLRPQLEALITTTGVLPVDALQAMFTSLDPFHATRKFQRFADMDGRSHRAKGFVAMEAWLNDGVPLAAGVARDCLFGWYLGNAPAKGTWRIRETAVQPENLDCPALVVVPGRDHIVPPGSAKPLGDLLPRVETRTLDAGHIGMVTGSKAVETLYRPLADWLKSALG